MGKNQNKVLLTKHLDSRSQVIPPLFPARIILPSAQCKNLQIQKTDIQAQSAWSDGMKNCWLSSSYREPSSGGTYKSVLHFRSKYKMWSGCQVLRNKVEWLLPSKKKKKRSKYSEQEKSEWVNTIKGCSEIPIKFIFSRNFQLLFYIYHWNLSTTQIH